MKAKNFLMTSFGLLLLFFSTYIALFYFQIGAPIKAEWWINSSYHYKDYRAENIKQKKIIIAGGSNALVGINSKTIEKITPYPVVNLATHAGLDLNFYYYKIKQHIRDGDIVVLPLEFNYYSRTDKISDWFSNNMMAWGGNYLKQLDSIDLIKFFIAAAPADVYDGIKKKLKGKKTKNLSRQAVLEQLKLLWSQEIPKWRGYDYTSLNYFGDINASKPVTYLEDNDYGSAQKIKISSHFLNMYKKIEVLIEQHHGTLYLTYPVTIRNRAFDLSTNESREYIEHLRLNLNNHNIDIQCNAALFNMDRIFFFDTHYHPNTYGALIRSENLANCLNKLINNDSNKMSYHEAINHTNLLQKNLMDKVKKLSDDE